MQKFTSFPRRARSGWWLLELAAGAFVAFGLLMASVSQSVARHHQKVLSRRRLLGYFFLRGLAAELPIYKAAPTIKDRALLDFFGIQKDVRRMRLSRRRIGDLESFRVSVATREGLLCLSLKAPGLHELRSLSWAE